MSYHEDDKLCDLILDDSRVLRVMSRFGLPLGFGEKTVKQVCSESHVDTTTFLALANFYKLGRAAASDYVDKISVNCLMDYLHRSHQYFLGFLLPYIRRLLIEAINCAETNKVAFLVIKFFDEYTASVKRHMELENSKIFPGIKRLISGDPVSGFHISNFIRSHEGMDKKRIDLRNIIIKYYNVPNPDHQEQLYAVLTQLLNLDDDLHNHCELEDTLFVPAVQLLEQHTAHVMTAHAPAKTEPHDALSDREKDLLRCVVRGLTNKEIAAELFISINTVITHRKNISRKLNIHSAAGLTIYAIVNDIVSLDEIKQSI